MMARRSLIFALRYLLLFKMIEFPLINTLVINQRQGLMWEYGSESIKQNGAVEEVLVECRYFSFLNKAVCKVLKYHCTRSYQAQLNRAKTISKG